MSDEPVDSKSWLEHKDRPLTVMFVRHGQAGSEMTEQTGPRLTELGKVQAERVAERLSKEKFDYVYASDLSRASDTALEILKFHKDTPFTVTADIREISLFHFAPDPRPIKPMQRKQVRQEREALEKFATHLRRTHGLAEKILVVCHGNFIRTILPLLGGRDPRRSILIEFNNTSVTLIEVWPNGQAILMLANCVKHLAPGQIT